MNSNPKFVPKSPGRGAGKRTRTVKDENRAFLLYLEGKSLREVAELTGYADRTILAWAKGKEGQPGWKERREEFKQKFQAKIIESQTRARVKEIEAAAAEHANLAKLVKSSAARELQRQDLEVAELLKTIATGNQKQVDAAVSQLRKGRYNRSLSANLFAANIFKAIEADRTRLDMDNFDPERDAKVKAVYSLELTLNGKQVDINKVRENFNDQDPYKYTPPDQAQGEA